ncbi:MAG TPA: ABC transporter substrate-binding protein [Capillimicrobium sp.]|nr:ABC transporter substrate-binding protein [Capillimicrobium sp.]
MNRRLSLLAAALAAAVLAAGCGEKEETTTAPDAEHVRLMLDYLPNADHAGIYAAREGGAFERAGLDVEIQTPPDPAAPLKLLASGRADIAISYEPEVLLARDKGLKVVSIGALVQRPLTSIMSVPASDGKDKQQAAPVRSVADLEGKTVGTAGIPYQSAYLKTILDEAGIDPGSVREVNVGFNLVPAMLSKRVDATLGAFWNVEGVELQRAKRDPVIIPVDEAGVPTYDELVLVAREEDARERGPMLRAFLRALAQGHQAVRDDPDAGVDALVKANPDLDRDDTLAQVEATLPAFFPSHEDEPFGWQDQRAWGRYGGWMDDNGLLEQAPSPLSLTNEFLPGVGLQQDEAPAN